MPTFKNLNVVASVIAGLIFLAMLLNFATPARAPLAANTASYARSHLPQVVVSAKRMTFVEKIAFDAQAMRGQVR